MQTSVSPFNWSLKSALAALPDSFTRARFSIIYVILVFSLIKAGVVICVGGYYGQGSQLLRGCIAVVAYTTMLKLLLAYPQRLAAITHVMLMLGVLLIWTNIFVYIGRINLITLQFAFMAVLGAFYALGSRPGLMYTTLVLSPIIINVFTGEVRPLSGGAPDELASPGYEIMAVLNFITIIFGHYYFYQAYMLNIREKERLNLQLQTAVAESRSLAESRANFLATMSHELRTPLNAVIGVSELMLQDKQEQEQKENLAILHNSAMNLMALINNILDINKLDSGRMQLERLPFNLHRLVYDICTILKVKARDKQLRLLFEADEALQQVVVCSDPTRLSQVIYNLVGNAIKFTEKGTVKVGLSLVHSSENRLEVLFSVSDTGIGIETGRQALVFESFTQAGTDTARKYGGTGLGLAIVKQVLELFDSGIRLESTPGVGSRFSFSITFDTASETPVTETLPQEQRLDHLRILVAEDNEVNKMILRKQLALVGIEAVMVDDGRQAYEACLGGEYDAVLLDLDMPGWDGYETSRKLRKHPDPRTASTWLIAFTASVSEQQQIFEHGFNDYLYKPASMKDLREKLEKVTQARLPA